MAELPQNPSSNKAPPPNWAFAVALVPIAILAFIIGSKLAQSDRATSQVSPKVNGEDTQIEENTEEYEMPDGKGDIL